MKVYSSLIGLILLFSSCFPYLINHEVIHAPKVHFTQSIDTLLILNNAGLQSHREGHKYFFQEEGGVLVQNTDSFNNQFLLALGEGFSRMGIATKIEEVSFRTDSDYLQVKPVDTYQLNRLKEKHHADFALVLNKGSVKGEMKINPMNQLSGYIFNYDLLYTAGFEAYDLTRNQKVAEVTSETTTQWETFNLSFKEGISMFGFHGLMRERQINQMLDRVMRDFFPHAEPQKRYIFYNKDVNLKDAVRYVKRDKWEEASMIWRYLYENSSKPVVKYYSAINLACHFEHTGMLSQSRYWLQNAAPLVQKMAPADQEYLVSFLNSVEKRLEEPEKYILR
ncbi:MAG: DUF6340 family protein [Bacteroidales bacterium]